MSGSGRKSQYRKGVTAQFDADVILSPGDEVARVLSNRGAHIFLVQLTSGCEIASKLPNKFHKTIWLKPKDFVIVETMSLENEETEGVLNIKQILSRDSIKSLKRDGLWPAVFDDIDEKDKDAQKTRGGAVVNGQDLMPGYDEDEYEEEQEEEAPDETSAGEATTAAVDCTDTKQ
jgi:translation initiation factor IF-1